MNIAVNTRFLIENKLEGIGWFTFETLRRIVRQHPNHHFYFFFDRPYSEEFVFADNVTPMVLFPPARHPFLWYWWFEVAIPRALKKVNAGLFLSTDGYLSLNTQVKTALVIHDIAFEHFPEHVPFLVRKYYKHFAPKYAQKASRIATVSAFSKQDIVTQYGTPASKIDVVYNGCSAYYKPLSHDEQENVKEAYTEGKDYFIYAGSVQPRKNIANLFRAFDRFKKKTSSDVKLVIVGAKGWSYGEIFDTYNKMQHKADVIFTGHLSPDDLARLMASALALTYVSIFEGFGIPILEAMHAGTPVITSNVSSMPEVAGDAGMLIDPNSVADIAEAMEELYGDSTLREELVKRGNIQRQKFSWDQTADKLWHTVEQVMYAPN